MINFQRFAQSGLFKSCALQITQHFNTSSPNHQLKDMILNTRSINQFLKIFSEYKQQFKAETYATCSKSICKLIYSHPEQLEYHVIKEVIDKMNLLDVTQVGDYQIISILSILRNLNQKNIGLHAYKQLVQALSDRYVELLKEKEVKVTELNSLLNAFYQLFHFKKMTGCKVVAEKLEKLLLQNQKIIITNNEKSFILFCLSQKSLLSKEEKTIRRITLKKIYEEFPRINLTDLVKIAQNLPRIDTIDMQFEQIGSVNLVLSKIYQNISELDELSIYDLLKVDFTNKLQSIARIYRQILKNVFEQIDQNGKCKLKHESVLKIFQLLGNKIQFYKLAQQDKTKFISFIQQYISSVRNTNKKDYIMSRLQSVILNDGFSNAEHRKRLMKAIVDNEIPVKTRMVFHLAVKGFDVDSFYDQIKNLDIDQSKSIFLIKILIILNRIKQNRPEATETFDKIYKKLEEIASTPDKFIQLFNEVTNVYNKQQLNLFNFNYIFQKAFQKLPNPFAVENSPRKYKQVYIQYMLASFPLKDFTAFINQYIHKVADEQFCSIIYRFISRDHRYIKPMINYSFFVNFKLSKINNENKSKKVHSAIIQYLATLNRFVVFQNVSNYEQILIFNSLHNLINNTQIIQQLQLFHQFIFTLDKYIANSYSNYKFQYNYRSLLNHTLRYINKFASKDRFVQNVLHEALQINIVSKNHLEGINIDTLRMDYFQRARLSFIKDNTFTIKVQKITQNSLKAMLSNINCQDYMLENEPKIIQLIKKSYNSDLINYLVIFRHKVNTKTVRILESICEAIISKVNRFQRLDLVGIARSITSLSSSNVGQVKKLVQKISETMKYNINSLSLENHAEMIKLFTAISGLNLTQYYNYLTQFMQKNIRNDGSAQNLHFRLSATSYQIKQSQLKIVYKIISRNVFNALYFFLINELKYDQAARVQIVQKIVAQLQKVLQAKDEKNKNNNNFVYKFFYDYIKAKYPEQTKSLNLPADKLDKYRFSFRPRKEFLPLLTELTQLEPQIITNFEDNQIVKFKNFYFIFLWDKKLGAYNQHYFLKRAVQQLLNLPQNTAIICLGSIQFPSTLKYINKQCPGLFNESKLNAYYQQSKKKRQSRSAKKEDSQ